MLLRLSATATEHVRVGKELNIGHLQVWVRIRHGSVEKRFKTRKGRGRACRLSVQDLRMERNSLVAICIVRGSRLRFRMQRQSKARRTFRIGATTIASLASRRLLGIRSNAAGGPRVLVMLVANE